MKKLSSASLKVPGVQAQPVEAVAMAATYVDTTGDNVLDSIAIDTTGDGVADQLMPIDPGQASSSQHAAAARMQAIVRGNQARYATASGHVPWAAPSPMPYASSDEARIVLEAGSDEYMEVSAFFLRGLERSQAASVRVRSIERLHSYVGHT